MNGKWLLAINTSILLMSALITVYSQSKVEITPAGAGYVVDNQLPVAISALVVGRDQKGNLLTYTTVMLPAHSQQHLVKVQGEVVRVEDFEVIHLGIPRNNLPPLSGRNLTDAIAQADLQKIKERLKELEISETGAGDEKIALAAESAQLWLEQRNDEKDAFRHDPLRMELQRQAMALDQTQYDFTRRMQQENERQRNELIEDVADLAMAYSMAADAKLDVLRREKEIYEPLFKNAKQALVFLREDQKNFESEVQAGNQFLVTTYKLLSEIPFGSASVGEIAIVNGPKRITSSPSGLKDVIEISASAPVNISVLLAEGKFDRGGEQKTFFRRLGNSNRWVARLYWPVPATSAQFRVLIPGQARWSSLSSRVQAGRPSFADSFQKAEKSMNAVIKKYKETSFRAEGADNIKTIPIP